MEISSGQIWEVNNAPSEWSHWDEAPYKDGDKLIVYEYIPKGLYYLTGDTIRLLNLNGSIFTFMGDYVRKFFKRIDY